MDIREDESQFSSKESMIFLPISYVQLNTSISSDTHSDDSSSHSHLENIHMPTNASEAANSHDLVVGSPVQYLNTEQYGVIKWIGTLPGGTKATYAGVEMVRNSCLSIISKFIYQFHYRKILLIMLLVKMEVGEELNTSVVNQTEENL